jgi:hypothetical protein
MKYIVEVLLPTGTYNHLEFGTEKARKRYTRILDLTRQQYFLSEEDETD